MKKEPKWLVKERETILNMSNKDLLENALEMSETVGADRFYEAQYDNRKEVSNNYRTLELLQEELENRLSHWLSDGENPTWEKGL